MRRKIDKFFETVSPTPDVVCRAQDPASGIAFYPYFQHAPSRSPMCALWFGLNSLRAPSFNHLEWIRASTASCLQGEVIQFCKPLESENPLVIIEEIDKLESQHNGHPASALLGCWTQRRTGDSWITNSWTFIHVDVRITPQSFQGHVGPAVDQKDCLNAKKLDFPLPAISTPSDTRVMEVESSSYRGHALWAKAPSNSAPNPSANPHKSLSSRSKPMPMKSVSPSLSATSLSQTVVSTYMYLKALWARVAAIHRMKIKAIMAPKPSVQTLKGTFLKADSVKKSIWILHAENDEEVLEEVVEKSLLRLLCTSTIGRSPNPMWLVRTSAGIASIGLWWSGCKFSLPSNIIISLAGIWLFVGRLQTALMNMLIVLIDTIRRGHKEDPAIAPLKMMKP
ncbi:hypothetical protein BKA70DRAFT_1234979 [Coprinopsis sp. MPI-PUGE-AT-0042]|nr:hypothetical protein BKA70DRAFT_1234979 [Coprinopsis sp. MPI-PUGE-AT-0042]